MDNTIAKLQQESSIEDSIVEDKPFGEYEEEAIISLAIDHPEFFTAVGRFMKPEMFSRLECQYLAGKILNAFEKYNVIPSREILKDQILGELTEDDPYEPILAVLDRKSQPREVPVIKDTLLRWARDRAFGLIYSEEAQDAYARGDYAFLEEVLNQANRIADVGSNGFWFFESFPLLFEDDIIEHKTTGFSKLDAVLNNGGPGPKEVVCWMAPTNVGKSIVLCNNAISSLKGLNSDGSNGQDVLLITFELDAIKTAMRCLGVIADGHVKINDMKDHKDFVERMINQVKRTYNKQFLIVEMSPDECSVAHIYALLDNLKRTKSWKPDVCVIDYMDLMVSRNKDYNKDDYSRQKHVANELRGLARNENLLLFTATQTNRSASSGEEVADLSQAAESFAKQFSLDYIVSLNQTQSERKAMPPRMRMFVAKNRNGPKHVTISCAVNYETMLVKEQQ
jgi:hypothetical protein